MRKFIWILVLLVVAPAFGQNGLLESVKSLGFEPSAVIAFLEVDEENGQFGVNEGGVVGLGFEYRLTKHFKPAIYITPNVRNKPDKNMHWGTGVTAGFTLGGAYFGLRYDFYDSFRENSLKGLNNDTFGIVGGLTVTLGR